MDTEVPYFAAQALCDLRCSRESEDAEGRESISTTGSSTPASAASRSAGSPSSASSPSISISAISRSGPSSEVFPPRRRIRHSWAGTLEANVPETPPRIRPMRRSFDSSMAALEHLARSRVTSGQERDGIFESIPRSSTADASHNRASAGHTDGVWESMPSASTADASFVASHDGDSHDRERAVYENTPRPSTADTSGTGYHIEEPIARIEQIGRSRFYKPVKEGFGDDTCAICYDDADQDIVELRCKGKHRFHRMCVDRWLQVQQSNHYSRGCPLCADDLRSCDATGISTASQSAASRPAARQADASARHNNIPIVEMSTVFENGPSVSTADAASSWTLPDRDVTSSDVRSVFENDPCLSSADATSLALAA